MFSNVIVPPLPHYPVAQLSYKDRRPWLIAVGIFLILIGALQLLFAALTAMMPLLMKNVPEGRALTAGTFIVAGVMYSTLAAIFITLGIGLMRTRTWARIGSIILTTAWLVAGVFGTIMGALVMPDVLRSMPRDPNLPANFGTAFMAIYLGFMCIFLVGLPLVLLFFFTRSSVAQTCHAVSGTKPWPAGKALVVGLATWMLLGALFIVPTMVSSPIAELFGKMFHGNVARVILALHAVVNIVAAIGLFRRSIAGWWLSVGAISFWLLSGIVSMTQPGRLNALRSIMPPEQQATATPLILAFSTAISVGLGALLLVLVVYSRRYFRGLTQQGSAAAPAL